MNTNLPSNNQSTPGSPWRWLSGVTIIVVGLIFLVRNLTGFEFGNWWALFSLLPAVAFFVQGWQRYQTDGALTRAVGSLWITALAITFVGLVLFLGLSFGQWWPIFMIISGLWALLYLARAK